MRVNRQQLIQLVEDVKIRSIRPAAHVDRRARHVDKTALDRATRDGAADVLLVVRNPELGGRLSAASRAAVKRANRAALDTLLATVGPATVLRDISEFGALHVRLTAAQLSRLLASEDARLLAVLDNKPVATAQLDISGPTMNMSSAWNAGFRGSGQSVVIFDTGVEATHPFLSGRVTLEGCFGSNTWSGGSTYVSVCPQADALGDSPLGLAGSAAPAFGGACSTQEPGACAHGTHVAGIAAGRLAPNLNSGFQGTAPDASIIPIQVFSYEVMRTRRPIVFNVDLLTALQAAANAVVPFAPASNTFTINMSLGSDQFSTPCAGAEWQPYITALQTMRSGGVPVVAATGNNGFDNGIHWPACLPSIIKVAAVANDGVGNSRGFFNFPEGSNVVNPASFPTDVFWLAPGGGNNTAVGSSVLNGSYAGYFGTSMAAPQIAGIYADAKGADPAFSVDDITNYFIANAAVPVPMATRTGSPLGFNLRRILLPAL